MNLYDNNTQVTGVKGDMNFTNQFLIATPKMQDPNFQKSVIYICQHDQDGAMGLIINKPMNSQLSDILKHLEIDVSKMPEDRTVFSGGPVQPEHGFVIHSPIGDWKTSMTVTDQIAITTSKDILVAVAGGIGPDNLAIALGYSGWDQGQLEEELKANFWLVCDADFDLLFNAPISDRWTIAAEHAGIKSPQLLSPYTGNA